MINRAGSMVSLGATTVLLAMTTVACSSSTHEKETITVCGDASVPEDDASTAGDAGTAGGGTFTNVGAVDFAGTGDVIITNNAGRIETAEGGIYGASTPDSAFKFMQVPQPAGAPTLAVYVAKSFRIEASAVLQVQGPNPLVLVAKDKIEVFGTLSGSGDGRTAVGGGSACTATGKGGGPGGGGPANSYSAGGGGSFCGIGGAGNPVNGIAAGVGGPAYGMPALVPLLGGSAGGGDTTNGGAGGGAIQLSAGVSVTVGISGIVMVGGGGGGNASAGGSGGAILIDAPAVTMAGILAANGGSGAASTGGPYGQDGQPGTTPATGVATAGVGSAADMINGGMGSMTGTSPNSSGAGGGGAGRIRINSKSGAAMITGMMSPGMTTACFSQGTN